MRRGKTPDLRVVSTKATQGDGLDDEPDLVALRALVHETAAELADLRHSIAIGERINVARLQLQQNAIGRQFRDALLRLPARHALEAAAGFGVDGRQLKRAMEAVIDAELRRLVGRSVQRQG